MANIIPLKDNTGAQFYPQTHEKAVVDSNGVNLQTKLASITTPTYVTAWDGDSTPVVANIPSGVSVTYDGTTYTGTLAASASTANKTYLVSTGATDNYNRYVTQLNGSTYSWQNLGSTEIDLSDYATKAELNQLDQILDMNSGTTSSTPEITIYAENKYIGNGVGNTEGDEISYNGRAIAHSIGWQQGDIIRVDYLYGGGTSSCAVAIYKAGVFVKNLLSGNGGEVVTSQTDFTPSEDFDEVRFSIRSNSLTNVSSSRLRPYLESGKLDKIDAEIAELQPCLDVLDIDTENVVSGKPVSIYKSDYYIGNGVGNTEGDEVAWTGRAIGSSTGWKLGDTIRVSYLRCAGTSSCAIAIYKAGVFVKNLLTGNGGEIITSQTDYTPIEDFDEVRFSLFGPNTTDANVSCVRPTKYSKTIEAQTPRLRVLMFGNSFTQDAVNYVPWILKGIAPEVELDITMALINGCTMAQHCANITGTDQTLDGVTYEAGVAYSCYHYHNGDAKWSNMESLQASAILAREDWDIVTFQQNGANNFSDYDTYYAPFLNPTFKAMNDMLSKPFKIGWLLTHGSYSNLPANLLTYWEGSAANSKKVMEKTPTSVLIPYGTAIQNLRTTSIAVGNVGEGSLLADNTHLQEGIATLCASYSVVAALLKTVGKLDKIMGEGTRPDATYLTDHNCQGANYATSGVIEGVTDANCYLAQFAAVASVDFPYVVTPISY